MRRFSLRGCQGGEPRPILTLLGPKPAGFWGVPGDVAGPQPNGGVPNPSVSPPQENYEDPHKTPASPVVHIRGLIDGIVEADLVEALQEFGPIRCGHWGDMVGTWWGHRGGTGDAAVAAGMPRQ